MLQKYSVAIEARSRMLELVPPGRVIFLRPLKTHGARAGWDAVWVKAEEVIREVRTTCPLGLQQTWALLGCACAPVGALSLLEADPWVGIIIAP